MDVVVVSEERLERTPDGLVWGPSSYRFWSRYLEVFDNVRIVARLREVKDRTAANTQATGPRVSAWPVPYYLGPLDYLKVSWQVAAAVRNSYRIGDAVIMRLGCHMAHALYQVLRRLGAPYGVEVIGDPYEVFAPGVVEHPLRPLFRWWFTRRQQRYCSGASAAAYVTQRTLQQRYPCRAYAIGVSDVQIHSDVSLQGVLSTHYSSIALDESYLRTDRPFHRRLDGPFRLVTVGSLEQLYKGTDVLIQAVADCVGNGLDVTLTIVGDGKYRAMLEASANRLGVGRRVIFAGSLPGADAVKVFLDNADLFVLPSRTEGLPRALIEAMARGLPCIASDVGGIPELLPADDLFLPGRAAELAAKIVDVLADSDRRERMSARNVLKAAQFHEPRLRERRVEFYRYLRGKTEEWLRRRCVVKDLKIRERRGSRAARSPTG
jgi:glycosyltransferase involved in cell wall biosynthesis